MESLKKSKPFKTVSKEESWSFINYLLRKMNDKKESYHEEQLERFIRLYEDESITKFVNLIDSATTTQYAHVIANYFKTMCYNNIERT